MTKPGERAPAVSVGGAELASGPAVVAFFTQECAASRVLVPFLPRMAQVLPVVAVSQDEEEETAAYVSTAAPGLRTVVDAPAFEASQAFGFDGVPAVYLITPDGLVADALVGWDLEHFNALARQAAILAGTRGDDLVHADEAPPMRPG